MKEYYVGDWSDFLLQVVRGAGEGATNYLKKDDDKKKDDKSKDVVDKAKDKVREVVADERKKATTNFLLIGIVLYLVFKGSKR